MKQPKLYEAIEALRYVETAELPLLVRRHLDLAFHHLMCADRLLVHPGQPIGSVLGDPEL